MTTLITRIIYVIDRHKEITACMIDHAGISNADTMTCYAHIGQHGVCSISWYRYKTKKAMPEQYEELHQELLGIYDNGIEIVNKLDRRARYNRLSDTKKPSYLSYLD